MEKPIERKHLLHESHFKTRDDLELFYRFWLREKTDPVFLIIHGFGEHSLRYLPMADELAGLPVSIAIFDLRGHGKSDGERVYVERFEDYLRDMESFLLHLNGKYDVSTSKIILFGHSMGGEIAAYYAITKPKEVELLILSSPCIAIHFWIPFAENLIASLSSFLPHLMIYNPVLPMFLTHDRQEAHQYRVDPLIQRRITLGLVKEMARVGRLILEKAPAILVPLYVLAAGRDRIVKKQVARNFFDRVASSEKKWIEFEGFYHEIFKEVERQKVYDVLIDILKKPLSKGV